MSEIKKVLMVLLENAIIEETHYITEREHVNTLEDVVNELLVEYSELANGDNKQHDKALHKPVVSNMLSCEGCKYNNTTNDDLCGTCGDTYKNKAT